jgi:hypothetical protein
LERDGGVRLQRRERARIGSEGYSGQSGPLEVWGYEDEWRSMLLCSAAGRSIVVLRAVAAGGLRVVVVLQTERGGRQKQSCQAENRDENVQWSLHLF